MLFAAAPREVDGPTKSFFFCYLYEYQFGESIEIGMSPFITMEIKIVERLFSGFSFSQNVSHRVQCTVGAHLNIYTDSNLALVYCFIRSNNEA